MKQEYQNGNMLLPLLNFHVPIPRKPTPYFHLTPKKYYVLTSKATSSNPILPSTPSPLMKQPRSYPQILKARPLTRPHTRKKA